MNCLCFLMVYGAVAVPVCEQSGSKRSIIFKVALSQRTGL